MIDTKSSNSFVEAIRHGTSYGDPIAPPARSTRATRAAMAEEVRQAFVRLYAELCEKHQLCNGVVP
jgi:hypothetical protein